ncbi:MAG: hypothetical protein ABFR02_07140 [Campylobacterota bacterium]
MRAKYSIVLLALAAVTLSADLDYTVTNTNFTISQPSALPTDDTSYLYNYNRLRLRSDYTQDSFFATFIGDGVNYVGDDYVNSLSFDYVKLQESDTPFKTQTTFYDYDKGMAYAKLYRLYGGYEDEHNRVVIGLQNITMGVGRLWTPTNLFNPRNTYALEPDETFGVAALSYTRHLDEMSQVTVVASQKADRSFKYAAVYKAYLEFADVGFDLVSSDETFMAGYELEANLGDTGIEVRSEGAYIKNNRISVYHQDTNTTQIEDVAFFQGIVGADYGFENGVTVVFEALYSSEKFAYNEVLPNLDSEVLPNLVYSQFYMGATMSYAFNLFLDGSIVYIESFNDQNSRFISPTATYTFNDYNTFTLGAMLQNGPSDSEFGAFGNTYYFRYELSF